MKLFHMNFAKSAAGKTNLVAMQQDHPTVGL